MKNQNHNTKSKTLIWWWQFIYASDAFNAVFLHFDANDREGEKRFNIFILW